MMKGTSWLFPLIADETTPHKAKYPCTDRRNRGGPRRSADNNLDQIKSDASQIEPDTINDPEDSNHQPEAMVDPVANPLEKSTSEDEDTSERTSDRQECSMLKTEINGKKFKKPRQKATGVKKVKLKNNNLKPIRSLII